MMKALLIASGAAIAGIVGFVIYRNNAANSATDGNSVPLATSDSESFDMSQSLTFEPTADISLDALRTGHSRMDSPEILGAVYKYARLVSVDPRVCMGILDHESAGGNPKYFLGDETSSVGPSIGPMQVSYALAVEMGMFSGSKDEYAAKRFDLDFCINLGCNAFRRKLNDAGGNYFDAIRRYNGSGSAARNYRNAVVAWLNATYGEQNNV